MSYIKFFKDHELNEIADKTHISPLILNNLKEKRFDKIEKHKFYGFIKIIEREYSVDLYDLKEEFKEYINSISPEEEEIIKDKPEKESSNKGGYLLVFILIILIAGLVYYMKKDGKLSEKVAKNVNEKNLTTFVVEQNLSKAEENLTKENKALPIKEPVKEVAQKRVFKIIPQKRIWFKVRYLDDNSSKEYLTSNAVDLNESRNQYIKFGHGLFTIDFNDENISPNTKKIVRYILIDGNLSKTKRIKSYE